MMMFSLAGIPPLAGFFAKFYVFAAAIQGQPRDALAVIGVVTSVVGAYYYLRIVKVMYFDEPAAAFEPHARGRAGRPRAVERRSSCCSGSCPGAAGGAAGAAARSLF